MSTRIQIVFGSLILVTAITAFAKPPNNNGDSGNSNNHNSNHGAVHHTPTNTPHNNPQPNHNEAVAVTGMPGTGGNPGGGTVQAGGPSSGGGSSLAGPTVDAHSNPAELTNLIAPTLPSGPRKLSKAKVATPDKPVITTPGLRPQMGPAKRSKRKMAAPDKLVIAEPPLQPLQGPGKQSKRKVIAPDKLVIAEPPLKPQQGPGKRSKVKEPDQLVPDPLVISEPAITEANQTEQAVSFEETKGKDKSPNEPDIQMPDLPAGPGKQSKRKVIAPDKLVIAEPPLKPQQGPGKRSKVKEPDQLVPDPLVISEPAITATNQTEQTASFEETKGKNKLPVESIVQKPESVVEPSKPSKTNEKNQQQLAIIEPNTIQEPTRYTVTKGKDKSPDGRLPGGTEHAELGHATLFQHPHAQVMSSTNKDQVPVKQTVIIPPQVTHGVASAALPRETISDQPNLHCINQPAFNNRRQIGINSVGGNVLNYAGQVSFHHMALQDGAGYSDPVMRAIPASHIARQRCLVWVVK